MTDRIIPYSQSQALADPPTPLGTSPGASTAAAPPSGISGKASAAAGAAGPSSEAVTLTPDAQTSTDLLEAARSAPDINYQAVESLKAKIAAGTYQVPPEKLATSLIVALAETR
jgi:flagellar biosynthesis anti-sigma factor FlgM